MAEGRPTFRKTTPTKGPMFTTDSTGTEQGRKSKRGANRR